jgi:hypothetical protein
MQRRKDTPPPRPPGSTYLEAQLNYGDGLSKNHERGVCVQGLTAFVCIDYWTHHDLIIEPVSVPKDGFFVSPTLARSRPHAAFPN